MKNKTKVSKSKILKHTISLFSFLVVSANLGFVIGSEPENNTNCDMGGGNFFY